MSAIPRALQINKLNLLKPLIRAIDNSGVLYQTFSMADKVTYKYYLGRKAMFDSDLVLGKEQEGRGELVDVELTLVIPPL